MTFKVRITIITKLWGEVCYYRNIENIRGNIWMHLSGLRMKDLTYYYILDLMLYTKPTDELWRTISYPVPV